MGYSDLTALHALWNQANILSIHGPMGSDINSFSQAARTSLFSILSGTTPLDQSFNGTVRYTGASESNVQGRLLGGNLSVLSSLISSGFLPSYDGAILLLEDTGEAACEYSNARPSSCRRSSS